MNWRNVCLLWVAALWLAAPVPYTAPAGDLNLDGYIDVVDVQCQTLVYSYLATADELSLGACSGDEGCAELLGGMAGCRAGFGGVPTCLPDCLHHDVALGVAAAAQCSDPAADDEECLGLTPRRNADMNCDGAINAVDLNFVVAAIMGKAGGDGTADQDGDGRLNFCDDDSDDDQLPDSEDCEPLVSGPECDDGNPCTADLCGDDGCKYPQLDDGAPCDVGDSCSDQGLCLGGVCSQDNWGNIKVTGDEVFNLSGGSHDVGTACAGEDGRISMCGDAEIKASYKVSIAGKGIGGPAGTHHLLNIDYSGNKLVYIRGNCEEAPLDVSVNSPNADIVADCIGPYAFGFAAIGMNISVHSEGPLSLNGVVGGGNFTAGAGGPLPESWPQPLPCQ